MPLISRADEAARYIRRLVFDGELGPGSRVPQDAIAAYLGMSRIPIREALISLETEGWVTSELNRGAFIHGFDAYSVEDHYALHGMLYGLAAQKALGRTSDPALATELTALVKPLSGSEPPEQITKASLSFHHAVLDASQSPRIKTLLRALAQLVPGDFFTMVPEGTGVQIKGMRAIARTMKRGDAVAANVEYETLMRNIGRIVLSLFERRGLLVVPAPHQPIDRSRPGDTLRPPERVPRMSRGDEAAQYIRSLIFDGELTPGSRVPQDDVAAILGVSRIPVREALIQLENEGWVAIEHNRGAFVNGFDTNSVLDQYELHGRLYGFVARRAMQRATGDGLVARLSEDVKALSGATDHPEQMTKLSVAFHRSFYDAAQSPRLKTLARGLTQLVPGDFFTMVPEAIEPQRKGMRAITRAVKSGNVDDVDAQYQRLMANVGTAVLDLFERRELINKT
jgi:DNA-binding GntR family transcriptional regulator